MADLKCVYKAATLNAAEIALDEFGSQVGSQVPVGCQSWRSKWPTLSNCFKYPDYVRTAIYTLPMLWNVHRQFRKLTKTKGGFTSESALPKTVVCRYTQSIGRWTSRAELESNTVTDGDTFLADWMIISTYDAAMADTEY